jgi:hypothetical protein
MIYSAAAVVKVHRSAVTAAERGRPASMVISVTDNFVKGRQLVEAPIA